MKIIIAGAGEVGSHLAKMLQNEAHNITVIENDEQRLGNLSECADIIPIHGNPTSIEVLRKANVNEADLFIAVSPASEQDVNLISALLAKRLGCQRVAARINNQEYLKYDNKLMFKESGIDLLFYPELLATSEIYDLLKQSGTTEYTSFSNGTLQLLVYKLREDAPIVDKKASELSFYNSETPYRMLAITRDGETIIPHGDFMFKENDLVFIMSKKEGIMEAASYAGKESVHINNVMIIGGGRIGELLAHKLEGNTETVKVIEQRRERCDLLSDCLENTLIVKGDGRNIDLLMEEDLHEADAFVAVTSNSEANILACVAAKRAGVSKTIAEVENMEFINLAESMGVDAVINKKLITASRIFKYTISNTIKTIKCLNGSNAEVMEYVANPESEITKRPIKQLHFPKDAVIGGITRGGNGIIAHGDLQVKAYDRVVVFALPSAIKHVNRFFV